MSAHTPGRLRYEHGLLLSEGSPDEMAQIPFYTDRVHDHDARRLVAAWNACEGLSTEALEAYGDKRKHPFKDLFLDMEQKENELLAALKLAHKELTRVKNVMLREVGNGVVDMNVEGKRPNKLKP
jgi:hypothetical protein